MVKRAWRAGITFLIPDKRARRMREECGARIRAAHPGDPEVAEPLRLERALELLAAGAPLPLRAPRLLTQSAAAAPATSGPHLPNAGAAVMVIAGGELVDAEGVAKIEAPAEDLAARQLALAEDVSDRARAQVKKSVAANKAVRSRR